LAHAKSFAARARQAWRDQPVAALSLVVSLSAFLIAAGGLYTSRQALNQTFEQYAEERALVLSATFGDAGDSLKVMPTDGGFPRRRHGARIRVNAMLMRGR
jgi:hypothetical protein